ncbi:MAG: FAD:protein FMN transferase [Planctomycetota bacterium]
MISAAESGTRSRPVVELVALLVIGCGVIALARWGHAGASADGGILRLQGSAFGTTWHVTVAGAPAGEREQLQAALAAELERLDAVFSVWRDDSELARLNAHPANEPLTISQELMAVLVLAARIHRGSAGAFDPSVGPLVRLWGFGPDAPAPAPAPPSQDAVAAVRARVGFDLLRLDPGTCTVVKERPDLELGLGAIAKGHAVDALSELLVRRGKASHIVEIGGEVRARGHRAPGRPWRVGIQTPRAGSAVEARIALPLRDGAVATSGDYRNFRELAGQRVSHIIDPTTGAPVHHRTASVSVLASSCAAADGWATALNVLGAQRGLTVAEREGLAALFIVRRSDGGFDEQATTGFATVLEETR